ncbi:PQQ-dependent sugar dehydrogenase [Gammaproteobacteria bacterium]|nr:PQQ-dependent sugar dehydrogenase [Gammaproteobacteria bacterium]
MNLKRFFFSIILIILVCFLFFSNFFSKVYKFIQHQADQYLPRYSQVYIEDSIERATLKAQNEALNFFNDHLNPSSIDLTLTKILDIDLKSLEEKSFHLTKYKANFLNMIKKSSEIGTSYIDFYKDQILIAQENGLFFSIPKEAIENGDNNIKAIKINSNINKFTTYLDFYGPGKFGLKDILVINDLLYVSFIRERKPNCFNVSILVASIDLELEFKMLFSPDSCIDKNSNEFNAEQTGARMTAYLENTILLSTGEFRLRANAQSLKNEFGKILSVSTINGESKIMSLGHRNPQGLYFSREFNEIWSTEHGPFGGDEINVNKISDNKIMPNFGWPKASYGAHYGAGEYILKSTGYELIENREFFTYESAPLFKSHSKYGFKEPLIQLTPSVGISQISEVSNLYSHIDAHRSFIVGTMGYAASDFIPSVSMLIFAFNKKNEVLSRDQIIMNERMRDLIYDQQTHTTYFSGDLNGVIGMLVPSNH